MEPTYVGCYEGIEEGGLRRGLGDGVGGLGGDGEEVDGFLEADFFLEVGGLGEGVLEGGNGVGAFELDGGIDGGAADAGIVVVEFGEDLAEVGGVGGEGEVG